LSEKQRQCLGCRKMFRSSSASNRFCKVCKKKRKKLSGAFEALDMTAMPSHLSSTIYNRYYDKPRISTTTFKSDTTKPPIFKPKPKPNIDHGEWGLPYPTDI